MLFLKLQNIEPAAYNKEQQLAFVTLFMSKV